ncbi:MAG: heparan-alpha-glucosaminide N-acetyltransferase domain-containing protein [Acidobacteriota bacterium]
MIGDASAERLDSIDVLRGATIAGMIVVNDPGSWAAVYPQLLHAEWDGWTYTDTIFPFFLFIAGVSMAFSFARRREQGATAAARLGHMAVRAAILIGIGLLLNLAGFLAFHREHLRLPGVLQRIGVCVFVAGAILLLGGARGAGWSGGLLLLGYWALMSSGPLDPQGNLAARIDRAVFGVHTWKPGWDPEGLLSTLPAIATTLLGAVAGERLRTGAPMSRKLGALLIAGIAAVAAGLLWGRVFPINKNLWTSSYAVLMSGLAAVCLAVCVWIVDVRRWRAGAAPFLWLGRNAIASFTLATLGAIALIAIRVAGLEGRTRSLWTTIYRTAFDRFADPRLGSLLCALAYLGLWLAVFGVLYRRRIFFKV